MNEGNVGRGMVFAVLVYACFSSADAVVKWLTSGYSVFQLTFVASIFSLIPVAGLIARTGGIASMRPKHPVWVTIRSLMLVTESLLCYFAFSRLPLAEVYPLIFATPMLVPLLAIPMLGEKVGWRRITAVFIGFIGVLIVIRPGFRDLDAGHFAALSSTVLWSLSMIILKRLGDENFGALLIGVMTAKIVVSGALMIPFGGFTPMDLPDLGLTALIGLLGGTAHCFLVLAMSNAPASVVTPFQYSQLLWAIFYGAVVFGDVLDTYTMVGAAVIIGSGLLIMKREQVKANPVPKP